MEYEYWTAVSHTLMWVCGGISVLCLIGLLICWLRGDL